MKTNQTPTGCSWITRFAFLHIFSLFFLNTLLIHFNQTDRSDKLSVTQTGTGDLSELREVLQDGRASYAYARVKYANDKESQREKFILIVWIGSKCKVMRKAKAGTCHFSVLI